MNLEQIKITLHEWESHIKEVDSQYYALYKLTGIAPDSPLFNAVFFAMQAYTKAIESLVDDADGNLTYYQFECGLGNKPKVVTLVDGLKITLDSVDALAELIYISQ